LSPSKDGLKLLIEALNLPHIAKCPKIESCSALGTLGVLGGALSNFPSKLCLKNFSALEGAGASTAPHPTPHLDYAYVTDLLMNSDLRPKARAS